MYIEPLKIALRVLSALSEHQQPDSIDLERLRTFVPLLKDMPVDEMACEVIQQAIRARAEVRSRAVAM